MSMSCSFTITVHRAGITINGLFAETLTKLMDAVLMIDSIAVNASICSEV